VCAPVCRPTLAYARLCVYLYVCLSTCMSVCLSVCLSVSEWGMSLQCINVYTVVHTLHYSMHAARSIPSPFICACPTSTPDILRYTPLLAHRMDGGPLQVVYATVCTSTTGQELP